LRYALSADRWQRHRDSAVNCSARAIAGFEYPDPRAIAKLIDIISGVDQHYARLDLTKVRRLPTFLHRQINLEILSEFVRIRETGAQAAAISAIRAE
jgi:hypothetical protein